MIETVKKNKLVFGGFVITFIGALFFSTKAILVKLAFANTYTDAVTLLALRMLFALPFYIAIGLFASNKKSNVYFTRRQWIYILLLGLTGYYVSSLCDFIGLQYVSAGLERLILFIYPTLAVLLNAIIFRQKVNGYQKLAMVLTYLGIGITFWGEMKIDSSNPQFFLGSFFCFLCAITFAIYLVGSGKMIGETGATKFTSYAMIAAASGIFIHYFATGKTVHHMDSNLLLYGFLLGIFATVIPTFCMSNGIKKIGSSNAAIISSIGPVSTILQAHFILGERITGAQIIGTVLVIIGVLLIGWRTRENSLTAQKVIN
ncbi:MAG TPA: DMT family transporter [Chitinophagaceae bacterium]|nr:DMT family transporter [Chitinophagaceae bacterium]